MIKQLMLFMSVVGVAILVAFLALNAVKDVEIGIPLSIHVVPTKEEPNARP